LISGRQNTPLSVPADAPPETFRRAPRSLAACIALAAVAILIFTSFIALGTWQVERRAWKLDLIARVEQRIHAQATDVPPSAQWPQISAAADEYRRVRISGVFLFDRETLVKASTELGSGFWVITPLRAANGDIVLINRGFVASEHSPRGASDAGASNTTSSATVTGLLRMTQPGGGFLRRNDPAGDRWYSRDVQAIAAARGLHDVAPYFIDADAAAAGADISADSAPVGGLTVIAFPNNHLVYAITWYVLALMTAIAAWLLARTEYSQRRALRSGSEPNILRGKGEREDDTSHQNHHR
jgi:surfeit locus 1 family protein